MTRLTLDLKISVCTYVEHIGNYLSDSLGHCLCCVAEASSAGERIKALNLPSLNVPSSLLMSLLSGYCNA